MKGSNIRTYNRYAIAAGIAMALGPLAALSIGSEYLESKHGASMTAQSATQAGALTSPLAAYDSLQSTTAGPTVSVTDVADGSGSFEFFSSLLRAARLGELTQLEGPYTVFMPVDDAFSRLGGEQLSDMVNDPATVRSLVKAHIVGGQVAATDLMTGQPLVSIGGKEIEPTAGDRLQVNGATVLATQRVDEGIIHFVDRLL